MTESDYLAMDHQVQSGRTVEGGEFEITFTYPPNTPIGATPLRLQGRYTSRDGGGDFMIELAEDGLYYDTDRPNEKGSKQPDDLLPWVITEGTWLKVSQG